jgi:hypothetical protein
MISWLSIPGENMGFLHCQSNHAYARTSASVAPDPSVDTVEKAEQKVAVATTSTWWRRLVGGRTAA